jgi:hypothetical protein
MLSEMQEALEMVRSGEWGFNECQDRFAQLFDQVSVPTSKKPPLSVEIAS